MEPKGFFYAVFVFGVVVKPFVSNVVYSAECSVIGDGLSFYYICADC